MEGAHVSNAPYNEAEDKSKLFAAVKTDNLEVRSCEERCDELGMR